MIEREREKERENQYRAGSRIYQIGKFFLHGAVVKVHRDVVEDECGEAKNAAILVARVVAKQELIVPKHLGKG